MADSSAGYSWEGVGLDEGVRAPSCSESDDEAAPSPEERGRKLAEFLLELLYTNDITARTLCIVCYWGAKAR